jgi:hypothetical protein
MSHAYYLKDWFAAAITQLPEDGNSVLTSVGSMPSLLNCDYAAIIISQPIFQVESLPFLNNPHRKYGVRGKKN